MFWTTAPSLAPVLSMCVRGAAVSALLSAWQSVHTRVDPLASKWALWVSVRAPNPVLFALAGDASW